MELLILLVQRRGELVSREEIAERLWGKDVFLDVDHGINTAIRKVRRALRDDPEKPRFVETVVGKGYRFAAPVTNNNGGSSPNAQPVSSPAQVGLRPVTLPAEKTVSVPLAVLLGGVAVLALLTVAWVLHSHAGPQGTAHQAIKSLAVLPLQNLSGDPAQDYFADGMTEELIGRLATIHGLRVISRTSVTRFKNTRMSAPEIGNELHVDALVEGSVIRGGDRVRVTAQLVRAATDDYLWSESYDRGLGDTLALESEVAQTIAQKIEVTVTGAEHARLVAVHPVLPEVYESYLKGEFLKRNSKADVEKSIVFFEQAIRKDPTFAPAYVGLAEAYDDMASVFVGAPPGQVRPKVIAAAHKALELDPGLAEPHALLASVYQEQWQWSDAEAEYKRALELNPNDVAAHLGSADWLLCQVRTEEALYFSRRARELDPLGVTGLSNGWILFHARRYDESIRELQSVVAVHQDYATAYWFLGFALIANGQSEEAIPVLNKALSLTHGSSAVLGVLIRAYAHAGRRTEALQLLDELKQRQKAGYVPAAALVNAYLGLDDREQAFVWLERAYQEHSSILQYLKVHPFFDPLRGDARFSDLLRRVGLDHS